MLFRQLSLPMVHRALGSPLRPLLLDAADRAAAPHRTLQRDVLVTLHSLDPILALNLVRRPHRPTLDAVDSLTALDASLALMPSSNLAAAAAPIVADTHNTLYRHLSLLLKLCVTLDLT